MEEDGPEKNLSAEELRLLRHILKRYESEPQVSGAPSEVLSEKQLEELRAEAQNFQKAQRQAGEAFGVLWAAQAEMAIRMGNAGNLRGIIDKPPAIWDDCSCNSCGSGGGTGCW